MPCLILATLVASDTNFGRQGRNGHNHNHRHSNRGGRRLSGRQRGRGGRQLDLPEPVTGGVDFSGCEMQDDGMCCVMREEEITTLTKDPVLECNHKSVEKCHYTYVTEFTPAQEEVCEENFEKKCQITFKKMAISETLKKCYRPLMKTCGNEATPSRLRFKRQQQRFKRQAALPGYGNDGQGERLAEGFEEQCKTFYETACTTKYVEKQPGKFVGDTSCEKLPVELCGAGCKVEEGEEECHDKNIDTLVDVPEEVCDLNPQKTCRFQTKLVPRLKPTHECTIIPQEICQLRFDTPREEVKPFMSKWCIDPNEEVVPDSTYDENSGDEPLGPDTFSDEKPAQLYEGPGGPQDEQSGYNPPGGFNDYDDSFDLLPPPDPASEEPFEAAASSYEEPIVSYEEPAGQGYGGPTQQPIYDAPPQSDYDAASLRREGRTGRRLGGGRRRPNGSGRRRGKNSRRGRTGFQNPSTLYGAPPTAIAPLAEYGASAPPLPSYGSDTLPSYGNRRSRAASSVVPVYVPGYPVDTYPSPHRGGPLRAPRYNQHNV